MKTQIRKATVIFFIISTFSFMVSCQSKTIDLVNMQTISLEEVKTLNITYASESITIYENDNNTFVLKEYMSANKPEYYASIASNSGNVTVNSGKRPSLGMKSYIELYLPNSFDGDFSIDTSSGKITINSAYSFENFDVKTASGAIEIKEITASESRIETSSGAINIFQLTGKMMIVSNSGEIKIDNAIGSGSYKTSSGMIDISFNDISSDITCGTSSGKIQLAIPKSLSFKLTAKTSTGAIQVPSSDGIATTSNSASGTIGTNPIAQIDLSTSSGAIEVSYQ